MANKTKRIKQLVLRQKDVPDVHSELETTSIFHADGSPFHPALYITHGDNATIARPGYTGMVIWYGTVLPDNIVDGDIFIDVSE